MKRELAFALEARSKFNCFNGRTRSSKSLSDEFIALRNRSPKKNRRVKTVVPDADTLLVNQSDASDESKSAVTVTVTEEESAVSDVLTGGEEAAAVEEVGKGEEEVRRVVEKVYVKRKRRNRVKSKPRRFTRSALVVEEMNVEELGSVDRKKMELKMSKKIGLGRMPINMKELLQTGLLEGFRVSYDFDKEVVMSLTTDHALFLVVYLFYLSFKAVREN